MGCHRLMALYRAALTMTLRFMTECSLLRE